jgi:hypothetical protein
MEKLTPAEYRETVKVLAHLDSEYPVRAETTPRIKEDLFKTVRDGIADIIHQLTPSPSKGNLGVMQKMIADWLKTNGLTQEDYNLEVWIRGGRKAMGAYNGPKGASV